MQGKLLKRKELEDVVHRIRLMEKEIRNIMAPLILHERAQYELCRRLEEEVARLTSPRLAFTPNRGVSDPGPSDEERGTKWNRLKLCCEQHLWEAPGYGAMLQRLGLTKAQALALFEEWKVSGVVPNL